MEVNSNMNMKALGLFIGGVSGLLLLFILSIFLLRSRPVSSCPEGSQTMSKVELYFGLDIPGGGQVEPTEWQSFIDNEITGRFPNGLTIDTVSGQWQDAKTEKTIKEESRVVMILFEPSAKAKKDIEDIRAAYKSKFKQDSVMRIDDKHCVSF